MAHWPYYGGFGPTLVAVIWALFAVSTLQIMGRIFTMDLLTKRRGTWSLYSASLAWLLGMVSNVMYTYCMFYGLGNDAEKFVEIPLSVFSEALYIEWISANLVCYASFFGRLSAALFMFNILGRTHKIGRWIISFIVAMNGITYLVTTAMIFTQCSPSSKLWKPELAGACNGETRAYRWAVFTGSWSAFADASIALYPVYVLYYLQMRLVIKILVSGLMGLGLFAAVCSVMKTVALKNLNGTGVAHLMIWGAVEMWVVLIASSFAPLQPLLRDWVKKTRSMSSTLLSSNGWYQRISSSFSGGSTRNSSNRAAEDNTSHGSNEKIAKSFTDSQGSTTDVGAETIAKHTSFEVSFQEGRGRDVESRAAEALNVTPWE